MKTICKILALLCVFITIDHDLSAQDSNSKVSKVYVVFKTHLDIGFTRLSSEVEQQYIDEFIPNTLATIEQLRAEKADERYVWTTGSWLISEYLKRAKPESVKNMEDAIRRGDIVWNALPYTVESEIMSREHFETCLNLSQELDRKFGKKTIAGKMTDVPGHTRGIITPLSNAGISFLHIGINPASALPEVPELCIWRNTDGKEIILMYQKDYGGDMLFPDQKTVLALKFTGDNHGPHSVSQIKEIYASLKKKYPNANVEAVSLNEVGASLQKMKANLPVITSEIGDTWIYGYASSPLRIAKFKALSRMYSDWIRNKKINENSPEAINFAVELGLVAEHTWGLDIKTHLKNWDKYDVDIFNQSRGLPEFKRVEQSWNEKDAHINKAISFLPENLKQEAYRVIDSIDIVKHPVINSNAVCPGIDKHAAYKISHKGMSMIIGELTYQSFSVNDFNKYQDLYLKAKLTWAIYDFGKPGLENTKAASATMIAQKMNCNVDKMKTGTRIQCSLKFPENENVDSRVLPKSISVEYNIPASVNEIDMTYTLENKPANRLPEAYLLSFIPSGVREIIAEKMGFEVNVLDVVPGGNRQMHAIDHYIDLVTDKGTFRVVSLDAPIVCIGEKNALNYSKNQPDINKGIHFCLYNNLWGTNFSMWFEGSLKYRFKIIALPKQ